MAALVVARPDRGAATASADPGDRRRAVAAAGRGPLSTQAARAISALLAEDGWVQDRSDPWSAGADRTNLCADGPTGSTDGHGITFDHPAAPMPGDPLRISLFAYEDAGSAQAALEVVDSPEWVACDLARLETYYPDAERVGLTPAAPEGAAGPVHDLRLEWAGGRTTRGMYHHVVVGRLRAQVETCTCDPEGELAIGRAVHQLLADLQDVPAPG